MKIAMCSDEPHTMNFKLLEHLESLGHEVLRFGSLESNKDEKWAECTKEAALAVSSQRCEEGIFFCWTGTGASIVANKIKGIRAALCTDAETAKGARLWNNANVLVMSNRLTSEALAKEICNNWFENQYDGNSVEDLSCIEHLEK